MPSTPDAARSKPELLDEVYRRAEAHRRRRQRLVGGAVAAVALPVLALAVAAATGDRDPETLVADAPADTTTTSADVTTTETSAAAVETTTTVEATTPTTAEPAQDPSAPAGDPLPPEDGGEPVPPTSTTTTSPPVDHAAILRQRSFRSTGVTEGGQPRPLVEGTTIAVQLADEGTGDLIRWRSGCNTAGGSVAVGPDRLDVSDRSSSAMACDEEREAQDDWVGTFFGSDPSWEADGPRLTLTSGSTVIQLEEIPFDSFWT